MSLFCFLWVSDVREQLPASLPTSPPRPISFFPPPPPFPTLSPLPAFPFGLSFVLFKFFSTGVVAGLPFLVLLLPGPSLPRPFGAGVPLAFLPRPAPCFCYSAKFLRGLLRSNERKSFTCTGNPFRKLRSRNWFPLYPSDRSPLIN